MHKGQRIVYEHPARFKWLAAGRRWRKTSLGMRVVLRAAAEGLPMLWGAPTFRQCRIGWDEMNQAAGGIAEFRKGEMEVTVPPGNGIVSFVSLDSPNNARGKTAFGCVIDEAGFIDGGAWYDVIRPMLSDCDGWALIMGTPAGRNWFWREHMAAVDRPDAIAWQVPTLGVRVTEQGLVREPHSMENESFPFAEACQMWRTMPEQTFRQEFLAEFLEESGVVFRGVLAAATAKPQGPIAGHDYVMGVDWGKSNDFTVIAVGDTNTKRMVAMDRFNQIDYRVQRGRLATLAERYNPSVIMAESNSMGEPIIEQLQADGLPVRGFQTTNATKAALIEALSLALERSEITLLNDAVLVGEMQAYEMDRLPSGMVRYSAPEGMHDDTVMATALMYEAMNTSGPLLLWGD